MAKLIYVSMMSLDGFIEDESGKFDWSEPDEELLAFLNERERQIGTYLYGRRLYESMLGWETDPAYAAQSPALGDYARIWQAAEKVVFSTTLPAPVTTRTRVERRFDPEAVRRLVDAADRNVNVGGANLASHAFRAGLVDEVHLYVLPYVTGGGKPCLPRGPSLKLELLEEERFRGGAVYVRYRIRER